MPVSEQNPAKVSVSTKKSSQVGNSAVDEASVCWIEVKHYPYQPDQQVELLHLQAEADALLIKLQAAEQKQRVQQQTMLAAQ